MIKWFKSIFGYGTVVDVINETFPAPTKVQTKKKATGSCDFDKLNKAQLLKEAKKRGVKANASLTKAEILSRVKSAK
jgi:hypothetical protein